MKKPILEKVKRIRSCHGIKWQDNYSWIHQKNILDVLKDGSKLDKKVSNAPAVSHLRLFIMKLYMLTFY